MTSASYRVLLAAEGPSDARRLAILLRAVLRRLGEDGEDGEVRQLHRFLRALHKWCPDEDSPDAVVWLRDTDGNDRLGEALRQTRERAGGEKPLIIGCPHQAAEAWVVCGLPDASERRDLDRLVGELGFDPVRQPERLLHQEGHVHSGKRVLDVLLDGDHQREEAALEASLDAPATLQEQIGLRAFLSELKGRFLHPIIVGGRMDQSLWS